MRRSRLGFLTVTGATVGAITLVVLLSWVLLGGLGLFSPGRLNAVASAQVRGGVTSHAELARQCDACHTAPWSHQTMATQCLACHKDVSDQIQGRKGLHSGLVGSLSSPTCKGCHTEHHGTGGTLTVLDAARFPHQLTGYSLRGHSRMENGVRITCSDCHLKDLSTFDEAVCADCHATIDAAFMRRHQAAFGKQCLLCHSGGAFDASSFDHSKLPFKLIGKHKGLACDKCHSSIESLKSASKAPRDCFACHAKVDEHKGKFGKDCGQCHTPNGWDSATFDHKKFPVNHGAEERKATCKTCHPKDVSTYTCYGCHEHTPANARAEHRGQNIANIDDCLPCHVGGRGGGD